MAEETIIETQINVAKAPDVVMKKFTLKVSVTGGNIRRPGSTEVLGLVAKVTWGLPATLTTPKKTDLSSADRNPPNFDGFATTVAANIASKIWFAELRTSQGDVARRIRLALEKAWKEHYDSLTKK